MKITFYHHTALPVKKYGGTERILFWHMKELAKIGHEVTLLGHPDSEVSQYGIKLIPIPLNEIRTNWKSYIPEDTDILHLQFSTTDNLNIPTICTVHGNAQVGEELSLNSVFVSRNHANNHSSEHYVYNALDFSEYPAPENLNSKGRENLLFLAKASWSVKNLKHCKMVAKLLKKHLHVAGGKTFSFSRFIHSHGFIGGDEKLELMRKCDAVIFPVRWHEPFGIAMIEGMSQGLPVFGSSYGSLPEVIGPAGICCQNFSELQVAVRDWKIDLSPREIREYAIEKFSINTYTNSYLKLYEKVINGESLNSKPPKKLSSIPPETLLAF